MGEICGDNRFEIIDKAKKDLIFSTNVESSPKEMEVLDNFLFRCWQMGWLDKYNNKKIEYRAFKDKEECFNEMKNHLPVGLVKTKISRDYAFIHNVTEYDPIIIFGYNRYSYDDLFTHFTFADGSPFGIKI